MNAPEIPLEVQREVARANITLAEDELKRLRAQRDRLDAEITQKAASLRWQQSRLRSLARGEEPPGPVVLPHGESYMLDWLRKRGFVAAFGSGPAVWTEMEALEARGLVTVTGEGLQRIWKPA